jgi:ABC-type nitrate/sulfonate/bicarbonate transport system substrate-binding protein
MTSIKLPLWVRFFLLIGVAIFAAGAGLFAYRYYTRPVTLTVAVGSIDGEAAKAMSAIASEFVSTNVPVRLKIIDSGNALEAANAFSAGKVDLAVVRGDVGDLSQAKAVVVVSHVVVLIIAPPGSSIDSIDNLKGHTVGVVGGDANARIIDVLNKEYDLASAKVLFKNIALADVRQALQSKQVSALLVAIPLAEKYLSLVRGFFQLDHKKVPVLIPIESAAAIAGGRTCL